MKDKDFKNWQQRRKQGAIRFTLVQGLLCWGDSNVYRHDLCSKRRV